MNAAMVIIIGSDNVSLFDIFPRMTAQKSPNVHLKLSVCVMF